MGYLSSLKISPHPSFPKRGLKVSTEKTEEPKKRRSSEKFLDRSVFKW